MVFDGRKRIEQGERSNINRILKQRGERYGEYALVSDTAQSIKSALRRKYMDRAGYMNESLDMIANKLARIANGDPRHIDSWLDIAGYAQLVVDELTGGKHEQNS